MENKLFFESAGDERATPQKFFDDLHAEFQFDIDCAASADNHKCDLYFGFGGLSSDALEADWAGMTCWLNPPYSVVYPFVKKAWEESQRGATVVLLLAARTETRWWHDFVWDKDTHTVRPGVEIRFVKGRLNFELHVPAEMRAMINDNKLGDKAKDDEVKSIARTLSEMTGLPVMAVTRIWQDLPDEDLMEGAPFPSVVVIFRKVD